jgi:hypothetical protein
MTDEEGLSLREAVEWCGSSVSVREITRFHVSNEGVSGAGLGPRLI